MAKKNQTTLLVSSETVDMLKTIKSTIQLARKKEMSYDEIIRKIIPLGLAEFDNKAMKLYELANQPDTDTNNHNEEAE